MKEFHSKWPTLTARHGHALQRTVTNSRILVQHHFMTVPTNFEADPIKSLGGVHSNTRPKSEKNSKWPPRVQMKKKTRKIIKASLYSLEVVLNQNRAICDCTLKGVAVACRQSWPF